MASPSKKGSPGGGRLLQGSRTRSYGSLVKSVSSPVRERRVEHHLEPGDTLQGLAVKYGVTTEQIKRANRLYTNDSIFLKKTLYIPVVSKAVTNGLNLDEDVEEVEEEVEEKAEAAVAAESSHPEPVKMQKSQRKNGASASKHDLSASDFLFKLDSEIRRSKQAATRKLRDGESVILRDESGCSPGPSSYQNQPSPRSQQRAVLGPVPLTKIARADSLRDQEDEIFKL